VLPPSARLKVGVECSSEASVTAYKATYCHNVQESSLNT
jgi:hypothetical protein